MNLPKVYDGTAYTRRLNPIDCKINMTLQPLSTVTMTLPEFDTIASLDWVKIESPDGEVGYYQVTSVDTDVVTGRKSVYLEHGACTLDDTLILETNARKPLSKNDTIANILSFILSGQSRWTVGTVQSTDTIYIEPGNLSRMTAILTMMQSIPDYQLEFVQASENDWHIDIKARPTTPVCEARLSRNLVSCDISYSTDSICTRVYADGLTNGKIDSANISMYGLHEETMSLNDSLTAAQKQRIASAYLASRDHPQVSVSISGVELSRITGLALDKFLLGSVCRVVIPWLNIVQNEAIVDKSYGDPYNNPEDVTFTLANATPDLSFAVASLIGGGGGGGSGKGGATAERKRFETKFEKTDEYFRLLATDTQWDELGNGTVTAYSQIVQTAEGIQTVVEKTGINELGEDENLYSTIQQTATDIRTEVSSNSSAISSITQTIDEITQEVADNSGNIATLSTEASQIRTKVTNNETSIATINQTINTIRSEVSGYTRFYRQASAPTGDLTENAIWIKDNNTDSWDDAQAVSWNSVSALKWREVAGVQAYIYKNGEWVLWNDHGGAIIDGTRIDQDEDHIALQAAKVDGYYAELNVQASQIRSYVYDANMKMSSSITQTASQIRSEVADEVCSIHSSITQTAGQIRSEVADEVNSLNTLIEQNSNNIALVVENNAVKRAAIVAAINEDLSSVVSISADKIDLSGYVTASELSTTNGNITSLITGVTNATKLKATTLQAHYLNDSSGTEVVNLDNGTFSGVSIYCSSYAEVSAAGSGFKIGNNAITNSNMPNIITDFQISQNGNTYTLQKKTIGAPSAWADVGSFSRATSLTGSWSSGTLTVSASPQGNTYQELITGTSINGTPTLNTSNSRYVDAVVEVSAKQVGESGSGNVVYSSTKTINATAAYNAGYSVTSNQISLSKNVSTTEPTASNTLATVTGTKQWVKLTVTVHGTSKTFKFYIAEDE